MHYASCARVTILWYCFVSAYSPSYNIQHTSFRLEWRSISQGVHHQARVWRLWNRNLRLGKSLCPLVVLFLLLRLNLKSKIQLWSWKHSFWLILVPDGGTNRFQILPREMFVEWLFWNSRYILWKCRIWTQIRIVASVWFWVRLWGLWPGTSVSIYLWYIVILVSTCQVVSACRY